MGVLEQVTQMRNQGIPENEIINNLQEQGISPKAINDALGQSMIKNAVSSGSTRDMEESNIGGQDFYEPPKPSARKSISPPKRQEIGTYPQEEIYTPQPQQEYPQQMQQPVSQEFYPQEGYGEYYSGGFDTETMIEIAEQVFSEKIKKIQKQVEELTEFKTIAQTKITHMSGQLNKIESTLDKLQMAILHKIGTYGSSLESIKKEMSMMQDSFGKMVPAIAERHAHHTTHKKTSSKKSKSKRK